MKKVKTIIVIILLILLLPIIIVNSVIIVNSYMNPDKIPSFCGWKPFIVLSGSMETQILPGDVAVVKEIDAKELKENDIIAFKEDDNMVITHRIIEIIKDENGDTKYKTKGDNNNEEDDGVVSPEQIEGIYKFRIGKVGNLALFVQTPVGMVICISIPLILLLLLQWKETFKEGKIKNDTQKEIEELRKQNEELRKKQ